MPEPNINLKSLEFNQIKNELVTYLKSQSEFTDYNFEGSALSTIIDLLAYNTFYQIFFQNILVNEMFLDSAQKLESIISHAKIQGYVVPGKTSATATLQFTLSANADIGTIPKYTKFRGIRNNSEVKLFYSIEDVAVSDSTPVQFPVYEAKRFIQKAPITLDVINQSIFIPEIDIDFRTLQVFVDDNPYTVVTSVYPTAGDGAKLCYLERRANGYDVKFSGIYNPADGTYGSSDILSDASITVTYAVPSGILGNGVNDFRFVNPSLTGVLVSTTGASSRGADAPSIEALKFAIPRTYSSQSRVVTEDDVKSFLLNNGYISSNADVTLDVDLETNPGEVKVSGTVTTLDEAIIQLNIRSIVGINFVPEFTTLVNGDVN
jgi:hypothetical protein